MFFKSMEIYGFKSFPDKTILNFDKRMTAVVGSNGNGKSNISDALRWVMGEQGAKSLRGDKMEDVIFHGTVRRKPMGFASVTLTIDNHDRTLRVDSDEVVISRKLYRSGESEYRINGAKTLLKNINDMFMGTGLGRDGYSVIGQGKVSEIVESGGSKRREVFEEAAGVSRFLAQKKDAENKLKHTEDNLLRIRDIASELEARLPVLEKQAAKAKKAKELLAREEELDITVSMFELSALEKVISEAEDKLLLSRAECENLDRDIAKLENEEEQNNNRRMELRAELEKLKAGSDAAKDRISDIKAEIAVLRNDISHAEELIAEAEKQIEDGKSGKARLDEDKKALQSEIKAKQEEIASLEADSKKLTEELTGIDKQGETLSDEYRQLDEKQGQLYLKRTQLQLSVQQIESTSEQLEKRREELKITAENAAAEAKQQRIRLTDTEEELEAAIDEKSEAENKLSGYKKLFATKNDKLSTAGQTLDALRKEYETKSSRRQVLDEIDKNMAGFQSSVKSVIMADRQGRLSGIRGTVADIISVDKRYTVAIEIALGGIMQNIVTDNEEAAKRSMRYLKENNLGRATFLPLTSVKGKTLEIDGLSGENGFEGMACELVEYDAMYDGIVKSILGKTAVVEDIDTASFIAKKYGYRFKIVTLDGQVINAGGSFTGGSVRNDAGIIARKQELALLSEQIEKLDEKISAESEQLKPLQAEVAKMAAEMEGFADTVAQCEPKIARLEAQRDGIKQLLTQLTAQRDNAEEQLDAQEKAENDGRKLLADTKAQLESVLIEIEKNEQALSEQRSGLNAAEDSRKAIADKIQSNNMDILALSKDITNLNTRIESIESSLTALSDGGAEQLEKIAELKNGIELKNNAIAEKIRLTEETAKSAGENEKAIADNVSLTNAAEKRISEINKSIRELTEAKEKFSADLARQEERRSSAESQTEKIISGLWDKYEITRSEAKEKAQPVEDIYTLKNELAEIKRGIAALGSINYSSIEELEEVSERYGVLSGQLKDVEVSKAELENLIADLIKDIKQRFTESFEAINGHFGTLFSEIFGGGEARLQLSDPEDVLNSDVEIYAAPPGKVIKSLSLLSGGEKSMVALTIYLAILLHRPTPFCMLDEVDAALDEANVQKYATYLKRFSSNTQLMVITHRRGTIELCDVLYGVYMQEKGVSGLLRQEFSEELMNEVEG